MRVMELTAPGARGSWRLELQEAAAPRPGTGEVRLRIEACAVCRTDLQLCSGDLLPKRLPIVPGHQIVGRVVGLGAGVEEKLLGRRLGVGWLASACGECDLCGSGRENLCRFATFTGWDRDGGFASEVVVRAGFAQPLAEDADPVALAPLLCGGIIGYRAYRLSGVGQGQCLGLFGFGASALQVAQLALAESRRVFVVSRDGPSRERARALGVEWVGEPGEAPPEPLQGAITFAPAGQVVLDALHRLDRGGTCVVNAIHLDHMPEFDYGELYWERKLLSVANFTRQDSSEFLALAQSIPIRTQTELFPLAEASSALQRLDEDRIAGAAVLIP